MAKYMTTKEIEESLSKIHELEGVLNTAIETLNTVFETFRLSVLQTLDEHRNIIIEMREELTRERLEREERRALALQQLKSE